MLPTGQEAQVGEHTMPTFQRQATCTKRTARDHDDEGDDLKSDDPKTAPCAVHPVGQGAQVSKDTMYTCRQLVACSR